MSIDTSIEYADSSVNPIMGCDGCELWNNKVQTCYAGVMTRQYAGKKGWPEAFEKPKLFNDRLDKALDWKDLAYTDRPEKPWLNRLPRIIFMNDMSDTFTQSIPTDWLAAALPRIARSPHIFLILTKRGRAMMEFSKEHPFPLNVWPGVSVTNPATVKRMEYLFQVKGGGRKWVSIEPVLGRIVLPHGIWCRHDNRFEESMTMDQESPCFKGQAEAMEMFDWAVIGGESGTNARETPLECLGEIKDMLVYYGVKCFVKQIGSKPMEWGEPFKSSDPKGGDFDEFPGNLQLREMPGDVRCQTSATR